MVRYSFALRGESLSKAHEIHMKEEHIDLFKEQQFSEHFLCVRTSWPPAQDGCMYTKDHAQDINSKGQASNN